MDQGSEGVTRGLIVRPRKKDCLFSCKSLKKSRVGSRSVKKDFFSLFFCVLCMFYVDLGVGSADKNFRGRDFL